MTNGGDAAERLRSARLAAGLTQDALAQRAQVSPFTVSRIERSKCEPSWATCLALALVLGIAPGDLRR